MKSKAAKYNEPPNTLDSKSPPLQCPVTRNKGRSSQVNSVRSQSSSILDQSSSERNKMQHSQENSVGSITSSVLSHGTLESKVQSSQQNSMIARASSVLSQTAYDSSKTQNTQENPMGSKAVPSQSTCDSSMVLRENEQITVKTKGTQFSYPNRQNCGFEEKNAIETAYQNARGQNEAWTSLKCDATPSQVLQKPRGVERRTYSSVRNVTSEVSSEVSARYADHRESQNHCVEPKIVNLRRGLVHQPMKNGCEIEYHNEAKTIFIGVPNSELTHQKQLQTAEIKQAENLVKEVNSSRQIRDDGSSNSDLCLMPAKEVEQVSQLDLPSSRTSGSVSVGTNVTTLTGNRLTIKSGNKEVVVVFMNSSQSVSGCGGQTTENDQEHEIRATTKSVPAASTTTAPNTVDGRVLLSDRQEMPLHSTCHTTENEASIINESISCENNSTFKISDASGDQANDDSYHHSFQKLQRPMPIILHAHRPLLSATINGPQTSMAVGANGAVLEQNTISSDENAVDNRRDLVPIRDSSAQGFSRNFNASDACNGSTEYQNSGLQMQFPSLVQSSAYREDARTLLFEDPAAYQYGRDQLSSDEDPVSEAHFQTQMPLMGQRSLYGRLPSYGQHALHNPYRDEFSDIAREPAYHVHREPIGVLRCRRFGSSYSGQYVYPLPLRNPERAHRRSFLDMRPHIYHRTAYPEQPFYGYVDGGNMFFMNRY
ncbi:uncharacterized protein LOC126336387 isoform X2 [Schistocerca gregaria]|uniref:uncharacterized protein LOC126336387 isoform X2 n=1 Tax=Schistocerca gregaria TaxID=7010 RepID=UPI00211DEE9B|nr:uncharacterized protein LOC126336387 isoform X2 [Schistocerca gregaria]XP_049855972.1 uncharacterized protein LOC126336387 isoform X2 [Schistocerca gregaria]